MNPVNKRVGELMRLRNLSQADLGKLLGISQSAIYQRINSDRAFSLEDIFKLSGLFEVPMSEFIRLVDPAQIQSIPETIEPPLELPKPPQEMSESPQDDLSHITPEEMVILTKMAELRKEIKGDIDMGGGEMDNLVDTNYVRCPQNSGRWGGNYSAPKSYLSKLLPKSIYQLV